MALIGTISSEGLHFRNRIINGGMVIDQRNAGASVTPTASVYTLDRFGAILTEASKFSVQQNAGSVTPPAGFTNYLGVTSASAYSVVSSDVFAIRQMVEGFNVADLGWGTASAQAVTVSFWVRSSLTGTFGGSVMNSAQDRAYPFSYTIDSADTWEYKTITIAGDTSGTWLKNNGIGLRLNFSIGSGSTFSGTANAWTGSNIWSTTGATSVVGTNGATFYITGVQLEVGSVATPFERRPFGMELALCQRYYETSYPAGVVPGTADQNTLIWSVGSNTYAGGVTSAAQAVGNCNYKVTKRATPTVRIWSFGGVTNTASNSYFGTDLASGSATIFNNVTYGFSVFNASGGNVTTGSYAIIANFDASAEL
jgi:hypothetical protein